MQAIHFWININFDNNFCFYKGSFFYLWSAFALTGYSTRSFTALMCQCCTTKSRMTANLSNIYRNNTCVCVVEFHAFLWLQRKHRCWIYCEKLRRQNKKDITMSELLQLTDAIVHEYLKTKDKNLAKVFEQKTNAVSFVQFVWFSFCCTFSYMHLYCMCRHCRHIWMCICICM